METLPQDLWNSVRELSGHSPFLLQPMAIFVVFINVPLLLFALLDSERLPKFMTPKSLHPPSGRMYQATAYPIWRGVLFWNAFAYTGYLLYDLVAGAHTATIRNFHPVDLLAKHGYYPFVSFLPVAGAGDAAGFSGLLMERLQATLLFPTNLPVEAPSLLKFLFEVTLLTVGFDVNLYFLHRLLHTPWFWRNIHYRHHEVEFSYATTIYYADFIDGLMNYSSVLFPVFVYPTHPLSTAAYYALIGVLGACSHSGWDVSFGSSRYHFVHHLKHKVNFGVVGIVDRIFGTYESMEDAVSRNPLYKKNKRPIRSR